VDEALTVSHAEAIMRPLAPSLHDMGVSLTKRFAHKVELVRPSGSPLKNLLEIEAMDRWPDRLEDYRRELLRYVAQLRGTDAERRSCQLELKALLEAELGGLLVCRDVAERGARVDAFNLLVSDTGGLAEAMELAASRVSPARSPNMISFLRAKLIWRANDILESETRRHSRRVVNSANPFTQVPFESQVVQESRQTRERVLIRQILQTFEEAEPTSARILSGLMEGESIAEIARRTGRSRQQIYRFLQRIREWIERSGQ